MPADDSPIGVYLGDDGLVHLRDPVDAPTFRCGAEVTGEQLPPRGTIPHPSCQRCYEP